MQAHDVIQQVLGLALALGHNTVHGPHAGQQLRCSSGGKVPTNAARTEVCQLGMQPAHGLDVQGDDGVMAVGEHAHDGHVVVGFDLA
jgi:hypothetical protein